MTRRDMEERFGYEVQSTYQGPLDWKLCMSLYNDLRQAKTLDGKYTFPPGTLRMVEQGDGFNIVEIVAYPDPEAVLARGRALLRGNDEEV